MGRIYASLSMRHWFLLMSMSTNKSGIRCLAHRATMQNYNKRTEYSIHVMFLMSHAHTRMWSRISGKAMNIQGTRRGNHNFLFQASQRHQRLNKTLEHFYCGRSSSLPSPGVLYLPSPRPHLCWRMGLCKSVKILRNDKVGIFSSNIHSPPVSRDSFFPERVTRQHSQCVISVFRTILLFVCWSVIWEVLGCLLVWMPFLRSAFTFIAQKNVDSDSW